MVELDPRRKLAGVLTPVFALRGERDLGIGDTAALREAISWASRNGIGALQILPVNEPGNDHSPYNLLSSMALDPLTIDTTPGALPGLGTADFERVCGEHPPPAGERVNYPRVKALKGALLDAAFGALSSADKAACTAFAREHAGWLDDYAAYRALVDWNGGSEVTTSWPEEHRSPEKAAAWLKGADAKTRREFARVVRFRKYVQWAACRQWRDLRAWAEREKVALVGDVPVGVSLFSADVWAQPELFDLTRWSGAPPEKVFKADPFTERWGQNWGFPLYDWQVMSRDNFRWWRRRLRSMLGVFHLLRVDHALGFFRIYSFPWRPEENERFTHLSAGQAAAITGGKLPCFVDHGDETEAGREHNRLHGDMVLRMFLEETGPNRLIAEDLGEVAPYVRPTLAELGIPGFKIPQWERDGKRLVDGALYPRCSVATFATHDHPPIRTMWEALAGDCAAANPAVAGSARSEQRALLDFCKREDIAVPSPYTREIHRAFLSGLLACNSWIAFHMVSDLFGSADRFNVPGSAADENWSRRVETPIAAWDHAHAELLKWFRKAVKAADRGV